MKIEFTERELTLVRVGLILRLSEIKRRPEINSELQKIYDETRALLLDGPLSLANVIKARSKDDA